MSFDPDDRRALYQRVMDDLLAQIRNGTLAPEDRVPSANQLAADYGIAQMTAQRALRELQGDGLIYAIHGRGSYVHPDAPRRLNPTAEPPPPVVTITDNETYRRIYREQGEILDARRNAYQDALDFGTEDQINATSKAWIDAIEASTAQDVELARYRAGHPNPESLAAPVEPAAAPKATGRKPRKTD